MNFLDVLNALGMVEIPAFGLEFAGVVTEVGSGVKDLKVGDPVLGLARGSFASEVVIDARLVVAMPDTLTFAEAATIPMTFLTAWYGLHVLGALQAGRAGSRARRGRWGRHGRGPAGPARRRRGLRHRERTQVGGAAGARPRRRPHRVVA